MTCSHTSLLLLRGVALILWQKVTRPFDTKSRRSKFSHFLHFFVLLVTAFSLSTLWYHTPSWLSIQRHHNPVYYVYVYQQWQHNIPSIRRWIRCQQLLPFPTHYKPPLNLEQHSSHWMFRIQWKPWTTKALYAFHDSCLACLELDQYQYE